MVVILPLEAVPPSKACAALVPGNDHFTNPYTKEKRTNEHKESYKIKLLYSQTKMIFLAVI